jgi:aldehyde dehydrogenase (NAD+)
VPPGVFNIVNGHGAAVGQAIAAHPGIDMVSFTGSTRAGILVAKAAADTVKRVTQELGGKSANIILPDADLTTAVRAGVKACFSNSGQSCDAPTRMLVPASRHDEAAALARTVAESVVIGDPIRAETGMGPVVSAAQFEKIQSLIHKGIEEGATLIAGGLGRPEGLTRGHYVRPTIFANVRNNMTIAREEIFGPVLSILPYQNEVEAVQIANDTVYGLSGRVWAGTIERAREIAARLRTGNVHLNGADWEVTAPFGGYKHSGNGREGGEFGLEEFLEIKAVFGYGSNTRQDSRYCST